jgi:hypothetical protein
MKYFFSLYLFIHLINHNFIKALNKFNQREERQNLIIGAISNYNWDKVKIFFKSYQNAGFKNCECVMFVTNVPKNAIDKIKSCGVIVYPIPEQYKKELVINIRWKLYEDYLSKNQDRYNLVFSADIRDVFFQRDLFQLYDFKKSCLGIAIEDGTLSNSINRDWFIKAYGEELYKTIMNERIFCVGTVWGTIDKFLIFAKTMGNRLSSVANKEWGIEQAVGNFIIYHDKIFDDCLIKSNNTDGYIMTVGLTDSKNILLNLNYDIFNGKGELAAVVHQYDRLDDLKKIVESKYNSDLFHLNFIILIIIIDIFVIIIVIYILKKKFKAKSFEIDDTKIEMIKMPKKGIDLNEMEIKDD